MKKKPIIKWEFFFWSFLAMTLICIDAGINLKVIENKDESHFFLVIFSRGTR